MRKGGYRDNTSFARDCVRVFYFLAAAVVIAFVGCGFLLALCAVWP